MQRLTAAAEQARAELGDALTKRTGAGLRPAPTVPQEKSAAKRVAHNVPNIIFAD